MTAQTPDILYHRGRRHDLCTLPLEVYFSRMAKARRPRFHWFSSALGRGYVATWEIRDGWLWLIDIEGDIKAKEGRIPASLSLLFPRRKGPVKATWMSGELRCPEGRDLNYVHCGFGTLVERDRLFSISRGQIEGEYLRINPPPPVVYTIMPDGSRTFTPGINGCPDIASDPFGPDEVPEGSRFWQIAAEHLKSETYVRGMYHEAMEMPE